MLNTQVHDQMRLGDFMSGDKGVIAGVYTEIGSYEVGVTEMVELGYMYGDMESAIGRIYGVLKKDDGTVLNGKVKFEVQDKAGGTLVSRMVELTTDMLNQSPSDMTKRLPFNATDVQVQRERKIVMLFKSDTTETVSLSKSDLIMSITRYSL